MSTDFQPLYTPNTCSEAKVVAVSCRLLQDCRGEGQADHVTDKVYYADTKEVHTFLWPISLDIGVLGYIGIV